jgi:hypothetical protein
VGKHRNNPQYFKGKKYKAKFLTSSILKKSTIIILKNKKNKIEKLCGKTQQQSIIF